MKAEDKLIKARVGLQGEKPFFAYLVLHLNMQERNDMPMKTCGVDNYCNFYYDKKWIEGLTDEQAKMVLCHEVLHIALLHLLRQGERNKELFNWACDIAANEILMKDGFEMLEGCLSGELFNINDVINKTAEEIYDILYKKIHRNKKGIGQIGKGRFDNHIFEKGKSKKDIRKEEEKWKQILTEAVTYAKQRGNIPKGMERFADKILYPSVNWRTLLYRYITKTIPHDFTYNYPSKKSQATGIYMPSIVKEEVDVAVSIDTSGSIGQEELNEFLSEIVGISRSFIHLNMFIIVCDCEIYGVYDIKNGNMGKIMAIKIKGGGGTSHYPVFKYLEKEKPNTRLLVAFTDGFTEVPNHSNINTLWIISKHGEISNEVKKFGEAIKLE